MRDPRAGGTIYIWTLGSDKTAHEVAREFGHEDVLRAVDVAHAGSMRSSRSPASWVTRTLSTAAGRAPGLAATLLRNRSRRLAAAARNNKTAPSR